jgi:hypothetical protein
MEQERENRQREFIAKLATLSAEEKKYWLKLIKHARDLYLAGKGSDIERFLKTKYKEKTGQYYGGLHGTL